MAGRLGKRAGRSETAAKFRALLFDDPSGGLRTRRGGGAPYARNQRLGVWSTGCSIRLCTGPAPAVPLDRSPSGVAQGRQSFGRVAHARDAGPRIWSVFMRGAEAFSVIDRQ